jgi:hypothetical protein
VSGRELKNTYALNYSHASGPRDIPAPAVLPRRARDKILVSSTASVR